jgi:hypothetical protein
MVHSDGPQRGRPDGHEPSEEPSDDAIIALIADLAPSTAPDRGERARMRERVLAGMAKPTPVPRTPGPRPPRAGRAPRGRRTAGAAARPADEPRKGFGTRGRVAVAAVAVLALVFSLGGMSLLLARDALPGDALYGIKRTGEAASLGLTFGDEDRAFKHLEFATARVTELETLTQRYADPADAPLESYLSALSDLDDDAAAGSRALIPVAALGDSALLGTLGEWAELQRDRLGALPLPTDATAQRDVSVALLERIAARTGALATRLACTEITSGGADDIGPLPATAACVPRPTAGSSTDPTTPAVMPPGVPVPAPGPTSAPGGATTPGGPEPTGPATGVTTRPPTATATTTPGVTTTSDPLPPLPVPTLDIPTLPGLGG